MTNSRLIVVVICVLLFSSCSPGSLSANGQTHPEQRTDKLQSELSDTPVQETPSEEVEDNDSEDTVGQGLPLSEFLGYDEPGEAAHNAFQEVMAPCMRNEGFDYFENSFESQESERDLERAQQATREWVEEWGFALSTTSFTAAQVGPGLRGSEPIGEPLDDPNYSYFNSLAEVEKIGYNDARIDCTERADAAAYDPIDTDFIAEFGTELRELDERAQADRRMIDFQADTRRCVQEAGFDFASLDDATGRIQAEVLEIQGIEYSDSEDEEETYSGLEPLTASQREKLKGVQAREIELALAVYECDGMWFNEFELYDKIYREYEREFVEANAVRLVEYRLTDD